MKQYIQTIETLIEENRNIEERTPFLDVSLGGLRTALDNAKEHEKALAAKAAHAKPAAGAPAKPAK
jgi:hypothetical protein